MRCRSWASRTSASKPRITPTASAAPSTGPSTNPIGTVPEVALVETPSRTVTAVVIVTARIPRRGPSMCICSSTSGKLIHRALGLIHRKPAQSTTSSAIQKPSGHHAPRRSVMGRVCTRIVARPTP